jgi:hypothetical protein
MKNYTVLIPIVDGRIRRLEICPRLQPSDAYKFAGDAPGIQLYTMPGRFEVSQHLMIQVGDQEGQDARDELLKAMRGAQATIEGLVDQQAMPDGSWEAGYDELCKQIRILEKAKGDGS